MKNILISALICFSLAACHNQEANSPVVPVSTVNPPVWDPPVPPTPVPPISANQLITGDGWSFTIPGNWQKVNITNEPSIKAVYGNNDTKTLVILEQESFDGKIEDYAEIVVSVLTQQGANLVGSRQLTINDQPFYILNAVRGDGTLWIWLTVKNKIAYGLNCGGPAESAVAEESCNSIANSFKISK